MMKSLHDLRVDYLGGGRKLYTSALIAYLEDALLDYDDVPDQVCELYLEIFSNPHLFGARDSWKLVLFMISEDDTGKHVLSLTETYVANFCRYSQFELCDAAVDYLARKNTPEQALKIIYILYRQSTELVHLKAIFQNLIILISDGTNSGVVEGARTLREKIADVISFRTFE